ncbi:serine hydrolase [Hymenobacter lutimineralis]|nr:serine hydrolase [Hymenobacter lutimineralis]
MMCSAAAARAQPGNPLRRLLRQDTAAAVRTVLQAPAQHRVQVYYTRVRRDRRGRPHFRTFTFRGRPGEYIYPASTVKLAAAALTLEALRLGQRPLGGMKRVPLGGPGRETPLQIDSAFAGQTRVVADSTAPGGRPTLGHYIRKVLLVSDNDAYNRLYEFLGQQYLNAALQPRTSRRTRLVHRLSVGDQEPGSRHANPFTFFVDSAGTEVSQRRPALVNKDPLPPLRARHQQVGTGYYQGDTLVRRPFDFGAKNAFPVRDQQHLLKSLLYPAAVPPARRFGLMPDDYAFLRKYLHLLPRQSQWPRYDSAAYPDNYAKFLLVGGPPAALPPGVRIYNKIGQAYGFLLDNACIVDTISGVEFLLAAVVYVNHDEVLNDDHYDYDTLGFPFLRRLGQLVYAHELTRTSPRRRRHVSAYWHPRYEQARP